MKEYIASVVRQTVHDFLKSKEVPQQHLFILLSESASPSMFNHINQLALTYKVTLGVLGQDKLVSTSHPIIDIDLVDEEALQQIMNEIDVVYVPDISHGFLAKLSLLIDDTIPIWFVLQMILEDKAVLLGLDYIQKRRGKFFIPKPSIDKKVQQYKRQLAQDGVYFSTKDKVEKKVASVLGKRRRALVLSKHLEEVARSGEKEIVLPSSSVITPMARDTARELGISINKVNQEKRDDL